MIYHVININYLHKMGQSKSKEPPFKKSIETSIKEHHQKAFRNNQDIIKKKKELFEKKCDELIEVIQSCIELSVTSRDQNVNVFTMVIESGNLPPNCCSGFDTPKCVLSEYDKYCAFKKYLNKTLGIHVESLPRKNYNSRTTVSYDRVKNLVSFSNS
jgi:hypothetical protein